MRELGSLGIRLFWFEGNSGAGRHHLVRSLVARPETVDCMSRSPTLHMHELHHRPVN
jgi:hypothetical protein